jgi:hypothetical protein
MLGHAARLHSGTSCFALGFLASQLQLHCSCCFMCCQPCYTFAVHKQRVMTNRLAPAAGVAHLRADAAAACALPFPPFLSARSVLYAPLGFFLQNPVGDMLVAFTKDQDILDENLMDCLHYLGIYGLIMLSTIITVSVTIPHFAAFGGALFIVTIIMLRYYLPAATQLKKQKADTAGDCSQAAESRVMHVVTCGCTMQA